MYQLFQLYSKDTTKEIMKLGNEKFIIKWSDFQENVSSYFGKIKDDREFSDVTLVCADDQQIQAHKIILTSASCFFGKILKQNRHPHSLIHLRGIRGRDLVSIVDFIYHGDICRRG